MRPVKVLALEPHFVKEIEAARAKEFSALCHFAYLNGFQRSTYELIAVVVSMVTFAVRNPNPNLNPNSSHSPLTLAPHPNPNPNPHPNPQPHLK